MIDKIVIGIICAIVGYFIPKIINKLRLISPGRGKIARGIERTINRELKSFYEDTCGMNIIRYEIKIKWDEKADKITYLTEEGDVVVKLSYSHDKNQSRSFTKALMLYLDESFIPEGKPFIGNDVHSGCKYTIAKEATLKKDSESYQHFLSEYLSPWLCEQHSFEELMNKLDLLLQRGSFRSILLREISILCASGNLPKSTMREEVIKFVDYLWNIANKEEYEQEHGVEPPLAFIEKYIKIAIVLVKRKGTGDISPHIRAGEISFSKGAKRVYLAGWGIHNLDDVKLIASRLVSRGYVQKADLKYDAKFPEEIKPGVCYIFEK